MNLESFDKNENKLLSVVLPTYGVQAYLQACLESVLETACLLEVIVVIDASPDSSLEIARQFEQRDSRVRVVINEKNQGLGASRNIGFRESRGKYVLFADSDDLIVPQTLQRMVSSLEDSQSDFVTAPADEFGQAKGRKRYWTTTAQVFRESIQRTNIVEHPELVADHTAWTKIFRSSFIQDAAIEWAEKVKCEDVYASMRAYSHAKNIDVVPEIAYLYRRRPGSITTNLTSSATLGDWARQTMLAFGQLPDGSQARQYMIAKLFAIEIPSRIQVAASVLEPEDKESFEQCIAQVIQNSDQKTLQNARRKNLEAIAKFSTKDENLQFQLAKLEVFLRGDQPSRFEIQSNNPVEISEATDTLLSVVMPTYNVAYWIDEAIRSILTQTLKNLELIIIDDSSSDETWKKVQSWVKEDSRVRAVRNPGNGGAQARNFGVSLATGKYLAFADGDDLIPENAYEQLVSSLESSGSDMAVGDFQKFWPSSTWRNSEVFGLDEAKISIRLEMHPKLIGNRTCWNRLFRRDFWNKNAIHFPSTPRANDILPMTFAMRIAETIDVVPSIVYHYRARSGTGSMTSKLATDSSIVGYFRQELLCAALIGTNAPAPLQLEYWRASLAVDGWGNLSHYLKSNASSNSENNTEAVSFAIKSLWDSAPHLVRQFLGPYKVLTYELVSQNDISYASQLCAIEAGRKTRNLAPEILKLICSIKNKKPWLDEILEVYRGAVLRPLLDDTSAWDARVVEEIISLSRQLAEEVNLRESVVPESREVRLLASILSGQENAVWKECRLKHSKLALKAILTTSTSGEVEIKLESDGVQSIECLQLTSGNKKSASYISVPVFMHSSRAQISSTLFSALRGATWHLEAVIRDELGTRPNPIELESSISESKISSVRIRGNEIHVLLEGSDRFRRAADWRIKKLKRIVTKGLKK